MSRKSGAKLTIDLPHLVGYGGKVELEGVDITHAVQGIDLSIRCDDVTKATLRLLVSELDITAETMVALKAYVEEHQHENT